MSTTAEQVLAGFVAGDSPVEVPADVERIVRRVIRTAVATAVAGAAEDGVRELRRYLREQGGREEATVFVFGDRLPAAAAATLNAVMCRALDFCDAMAPGLHIGSSLVPAAFAAAEAAGGCTGAEFLSAVTLGAEVGARFNLDATQYDGFDPTGVAGVFAATAASARIMRLSPVQTLHALALAFNRCGGSFQSNVDGSLAVRLIQGWVAEAGVSCARLARAGFTGPTRFLSGVYGYLHLFGRDRDGADRITGALGADWRVRNTMFKRYPSCGGTQAVTQLALDLRSTSGLRPAGISAIRIELPPYTFKLVGHPLRLGANPRVDAQFSAQYCVASALVRGGSRLVDFRPEAVADAEVLDLVRRIEVVSAERLGVPGAPCAVLHVRTADGREHSASIDIPPGFPGNELSEADHAARVADCVEYAPQLLPGDRVAAFGRQVDRLTEVPDVRQLLSLLTGDTGVASPARGVLTTR